MIKSVALISLSLAALIGCGGGESKPKVTVPDAPINNPTPDAPDAPGCTAPAAIPGGMLADSGMNKVFTYTKDAMPATSMPPGPAGDQEEWVSLVAINEDPTPDALLLLFAEGPPPSYTEDNFPPAPFTIDLSGPDGDATKCSVCIGILTDVNTANTMMLEYVDDYMPSAGTVSITALSATKITGSITGISFEHVDIDYMAGTQTPNASGCTAMMGDLMFDSVPAMAMAKDGRQMWGVKVSLPSNLQNATLTQQ